MKLLFKRKFTSVSAWKANEMGISIIRGDYDIK